MPRKRDPGKEITQACCVQLHALPAPPCATQWPRALLTRVGARQICADAVAVEPNSRHAHAEKNV
eukprot:7715635-Pyramimonas_sp.AAC.1